MDARTAKDAPVTLPFQPEPLAHHVARDHHGDGTTTAIGRAWRPGEAERCRLCERQHCHAHGGFCLVQVRLDVSDADAKLFSTVGLRRSAGGVFAPVEHAGLIDLDGVAVAEARPGQALEEHPAKPLGNLAL